MKKILYAFVVFGIVGFGLYTASNFQKQKFLKICQKESSSQGGIESCLQYHLQSKS
jgi:hypothetical protein|tara:strand:- start:756 stop:923 length:168 start_codon:yes stop_codon:yes gene_type:complete